MLVVINLQTNSLKEESAAPLGFMELYSEFQLTV